MDMSCVDVAITDIRMLMARNGSKGRKWSWTDAGWGGDWLNIKDADHGKYFQNNLKTAYTMTYNVPLDDLAESKWIFCCDQN